MTGRRTPGRKRVCRQPASATALAVSVLALCLLTIPAPLPAAAAATALTSVPAVTPVATPTPPLTVTLSTVTPTVALPKAPITITGRVRNTGGVPITSPVAQALIGLAPLTSRQAVSDWATSTSEHDLRSVARTPLGKTLAPGSVTAFTLTIPANEISHRRSFAILPVRVEVVGTMPAGTQNLGEVNTFLPTLASVKAFEPLSIAWLVPLTLDPDPALQGMASPARTAAWTKAIGPGSRLDRLIQGTENANVTWAIDPAILGPQETPPAVKASVAPRSTASTSTAPSSTAPSSTAPSSTAPSSTAPSSTAPSSTAPPSPAPSPSKLPTPGTTAPPDPVTAATTALAERLRAAAPRHTLWALPYADPDLAALLPTTSGNRVLGALMSHPSALDVSVGPARTDIAWPVTGTLTPQTQARLRRVFASTGLAASVTSASTLDTDNGPTSDASRKSGGGLPLLAYDEALSRTVAQTSSRTAGAITIQRFLADSMALLGERPGTRNRSVLVAEPRTFAGDPTVLRSLFAAVAKAPWLVPTTTEQLLSASEELPPEAPGQGTTVPPTSAPSSPATPAAPDPLSPGSSPLTPDQLASIPGTLSAILGIASILGDGQLFTTTWTDAQVQQLSARWRGHPEGIAGLDAATRAAISTVSRNVRVAPSSVNFFAERGVLQVTVVNDLTVPIHDVRLTLTPAQPRLRIERQPGPLRIGAKSRATVPLQVTSIAAGVVSVEAVLSTPNGTPLGEDASVNVRVQPPATWVYWVLGGLAGMVLVLGTQRSLRRGSTRAAHPDAQEPPLDD